MTLDQDLNAVTKHDPSAAPLFPGLRDTENAAVVKNPVSITAVIRWSSPLAPRTIMGMIASGSAVTSPVIISFGYVDQTCVLLDSQCEQPKVAPKDNGYTDCRC
jgi:hypothetical protein